jgi:hypothetical protein
MMASVPAPWHHVRGSNLIPPTVARPDKGKDGNVVVYGGQSTP